MEGGQNMQYGGGRAEYVVWRHWRGRICCMEGDRAEYVAHAVQ